LARPDDERVAVVESVVVYVVEFRQCEIAFCNDACSDCSGPVQVVPK